MIPSRFKYSKAWSRLSVFFVAIAFVAQIFAVTIQPEPSLATSSNDIVPGGFSTKAEALNHCRSNRYDFRETLEHFGVSCDDLANSSKKSIRSTDHNKELMSLGRLPYGKEGEKAVRIEGKTYYQRYLWSWDSWAYSTYDVLAGKLSNGMPFYILYNCGNITVLRSHAIPEPEPEPEPEPDVPGVVTVDPPQAREPEPEPEDACPELPGKQTENDECIPCEEADGADDTTACLILSKSATNETQGIEEADGTTAKAGDIITYDLYARNTGAFTVEDFVIEEHMGDVLEYALITDFHGGQIDENSVVRWEPRNIEPEATVTERITVQIKDEIPNTPVASSNPGSYDLTLTNVYGNTIEIHLPTSPAKTTEQVVQTLPETGPNASIVLSAGTVAIVGFFFARTRLYTKELDIVRHDYAASGGQL